MVNAVSGSTVGSVRTKSVKEKTIDSGKIGFVAGGVLGATYGNLKNNWLNDGKPSDKFIKSVKKELVKNLPDEDQKELKKVNTFFSKLVDSETTMEDLRSQIENSEELKKALPKKNGKKTSEILDDIFSNPNKNEIKQELNKMQERTNIDKKVTSHAAKKLFNDNFDKNKQKLLKSESTTDEMFQILKKAKQKVKINSSKNNLIIGGILGGIIGLFAGANKYNKTDKK